jgi:hypothetical protein
MGLSVTFVSGPRAAGKSALIHSMLDHVWKKPPHYLRLVPIGSDKRPPVGSEGTTSQCHVASARWLEYEPELVFDILPGALSGIHKKDRYGAVVIEADADPALRHAYPYDHRIFVMPLPQTLQDVFRDSVRAAHELRRALDDTAAFATEIFGLFAKDGMDDGDCSEPRPPLSRTQMRGFLYSPLGDELATRIQLQPPYHGLVESDVIVVNTSIGTSNEQTAECLRRIERLLERVRGKSGRRGELFLCDPVDVNTRQCKALQKALEPMCQGGK